MNEDYTRKLERLDKQWQGQEKGKRQRGSDSGDGDGSEVQEEKVLDLISTMAINPVSRSYSISKFGVEFAYAVGRKPSIDEVLMFTKMQSERK